MIDITDTKAIYDRIDSLRIERGWTNYELAKRASISQTAIRHWRDGEASPSLALLDAVCSAFDITLIDFLTDDEEKVSLTVEQRELIHLWSKLSSEQRKSVLNLIKSM